MPGEDLRRPELRRHIPQPGISVRGQRSEYGLGKIGVCDGIPVDHEIDGNSVARGTSAILSPSK